jgi:hypothetical protein
VCPHATSTDQASAVQAFVIDQAATPERLAQAATILERCMGPVLLAPCLILRPSARQIRCEIVDTTPAAHRCEEEYKVMVENAARALKRSKLGAMLPSRPLRWAVIEERSDGIVEAWSG